MDFLPNVPASYGYTDVVSNAVNNSNTANVINAVDKALNSGSLSPAGAAKIISYIENYQPSTPSILNSAYVWLKGVLGISNDYNSSSGVTIGGGLRGSTVEVPTFGLTTASPAFVAGPVDFSEVSPGQTESFAFDFTSEAPGDEALLMFNDTVLWSGLATSFLLNTAYEADFSTDAFAGQIGTLAFVVDSAEQGQTSFNIIDTTLSGTAIDVPEPAPVALFVFGMIGTGIVVRRRRPASIPTAATYTSSH